MQRLWLLLSLPALACGLLRATPTVAPTQAAAPLASATASPVSQPSASPPAATAAAAAGFPDPDAFRWTQIASGLRQPVDIQDARDRSPRLFIVERPGRVRILQAGQLLAAPFLDITDRVEDGSSEQGLLGLAFHPDFANNGFFYLNYTGAGGGTVIARFSASSDPNLADAASETRLLTVAQPFANHNGGGVAFGPDGYLYLGLGDGGAAGDPFGNGQNLDSLPGKILRIDVNEGEPYSIPADNPFGSEVWHFGLRNPWRFSFDRATGDMYVADVGQNQWEEIDFAPSGQGGLNFGWNIMEGNHDYADGSQSGLAAPVAEYDHSQGCSVTGGYVYRGLMPEWQGLYLYGDYCSGRIWGLLNSDQGWQARELFRPGYHISTFGEDASGELYVADLRGEIFRLERR